MIVYSILKKASSLINPQAAKSLCMPISLIKNAIRHSGGYDPRKFYIHPSYRGMHKFNDMLHFYILLGVIPLFSITFYANVFVGPSTLKAIPEGYEPDHWEYYQHPVCRWFAKYMYHTHQEEYERLVHKNWQIDDMTQMMLIENKVMHLRNTRQDSEDAASMRKMPLDYIIMIREQVEHSKVSLGEGED